jgi:GH25 family lysozyme M1 (1,4-beta-N-acetylmuramidase)
LKFLKILIVLLSSVILFQSATISRADTSPQLQAVGPGSHILGLDVSRYQHSGASEIDFSRMAKAQVSFLWINGGNTLPGPDKVAEKFYRLDRRAAQAQGIYTGFYYFVHLPDSSSREVILSNARNQANKILQRINLDGGLNQLDMPVALDIETTCTKTGSFGACLHYMSSRNCTLWISEWSKVIVLGTNRIPVIYSFRSLLHNVLGRATELSRNPLWIATSGIDPAITGSQPTALKNGCSTNIWTRSGCKSQWTFWQYSSSGKAQIFGLPHGSVDLDIFGGNAVDFLNFQSKGVQVPFQEVVDQTSNPNFNPSSSAPTSTPTATSQGAPQSP